jgi:hypothetical protein
MGVWTATPRTWVAGEVPTAANFNTDVRDFGRAFSDAWVSYTPTVTSAGGTFTSVTPTGFYMRAGKMIHARIKIIVTTVGTATGAIRVTLPVNTAIEQFMGHGRQDTGTGHMLQVRWFNSSTVEVYKYDNTSAIAAQTNFLMLTYEVG